MISSRSIRTMGIMSFSLVMLSCAWPVEAKDEVESVAKEENTYELLQLFGDVYDRVKRDYVEDVSDTDLIEAAINGMLTSLDPHSSYLNNKSFEEMQVQTRGEFGGLGIEVTMENGLVKVVSPIDDTPAYKAGVEAGDYISQIDGEAVMGLTLSEAVEKMRGRVGTDIIITVLREAAPEPFDVTITRDLIRIKSVRSRAEGNIGYVRITSFSEQTYVGLAKEVKKLRGEIKNMNGLVLDLRNNPGGLLDQAIEVSDAFLERGEVVSTRERDPKNTKRFVATEEDLIDGLPMVVLINHGSASASEIVAGALQDHKRAVVMGTKSFGKGSVQTVIPLRGHGAMRLTTSRYYTPSGTSIQATGIEPDIKVEPSKVVAIGAEKVRSEADLRGRLSNPQDKQKMTVEEKKAAKEEEAKQEAKEDYQLARALDLLQGLAVYKEQDGK